MDEFTSADYLAETYHLVDRISDSLDFNNQELDINARIRAGKRLMKVYTNTVMGKALVDRLQELEVTAEVLNTLAGVETEVLESLKS